MDEAQRDDLLRVVVETLEKSQQRSVSESASLDKLAHHVERVAVGIKDLEKTVEKHNHTIHGNGNAGIKTELATLKAKVENLVWWHRILITASLGALATGVAALVHTVFSGG